MKLYGAINDGYRFIYSNKKSVIEDWLYMFQENFCILKVFEIEVPETEKIIKENYLLINISFDKRKIKQEEYIDIAQKKVGVILNNGIGLIVLYEENQCKNENIIYLEEEEQIILMATRCLIDKKDKNGINRY